MTTAEVIREIEATLEPINEQLGQLSQIAALLKTLKGIVEDHARLSQEYLKLREENQKHIERRLELQHLLAKPD
jgi:hypothetical protein